MWFASRNSSEPICKILSLTLIEKVQLKIFPARHRAKTITTKINKLCKIVSKPKCELLLYFPEKKQSFGEVL